MVRADIDTGDEGRAALGEFNGFGAAAAAEIDDALTGDFTEQPIAELAVELAGALKVRFIVGR